MWHYSDVIMGATASQITSITVVYSSVCSAADQRKHRVTGLCVGNSPVTGEFPAQMASDGENASIDVIMALYAILRLQLTMLLRDTWSIY